MIEKPKGFEYWIEKDGAFTISENAPDWAKEEFERYKDYINEKDGEVEHQY